VLLGMTKEVDLPRGHMGSTELTSWYAKLVGIDIPTKVGTSTRKVDMIRRKHMNGSDK
jgi:hypothetical protein